MLIQARVDHKRPKHDVLKKQGYTCVDTHFHTKYSDGTRGVSAVIKKAKKLGIGVAITDHNEIRGALEIDKDKSILSIPGIEATSKEGIHVLYHFYNTSELVEFYNRLILPNKNGSHFLNIGFADLMDASQDYNCNITAPHPYGIGWTGICTNHNKTHATQKMLGLFDSIEIINGAALKNMNTKALLLAQKLNSGITGGSDGHRLFELGGVLTYLKHPSHREDFIDSIKNHKSFVLGRDLTVMEKIATHSTKIAIPVRHPIQYMKMGMGITKSLIKRY